MSNPTKEKLDLLEESVRAQPPCLHLAKSCRGLVFGDGNPNASVVFIGEAPGAEEDKQGLPFVGRSGRLLNDLLAEVGLQRSDVYITNIVKFRPPDNRDPEPEEKAAFLPILLQQLDIIAPKVIVTLGRHSTGCLLPKFSGKTRGQPQRDEQGRTILPMFHPAAALYNSSNMPALKAQFQTLKAILDGKVQPPAHQENLL